MAGKDIRTNYDLQKVTRCNGAGTRRFARVVKRMWRVELSGRSRLFRSQTIFEGTPEAAAEVIAWHQK